MLLACVAEACPTYIAAMHSFKHAHLSLQDKEWVFNCLFVYASLHSTELLHFSCAD